MQNFSPTLFPRLVLLAAVCSLGSCSDPETTSSAEASVLDLTSVDAEVGNGPTISDLGGADTSTPDPTDQGTADPGGPEQPDMATEDTDNGEEPDAGEADVGPASFRSCFAEQLPDGEPLVDYDALGAVIGSHCMGTNHQDIVDVERVVFVGDSIAVGTPPTPNAQWYRNIMADALAARFGLEAPDRVWRLANVIDGVALSRESGDFACCAKWGARTDDMTRPPHEQMQTCIPENQRHKRTLIVMTVGGNDFFAWAQDLVDGTSEETLRAMAEQAVTDIEAVQSIMEEVHYVVESAGVEARRIKIGILIAVYRPDSA